MRVETTGLDDEQAFRARMDWLFRPASLPLRPEDAALLEAAQRFRFGPDGSRVGWSVGAGPLVVLAHGWGGRGVQMAPLALALAQEGFRCVFHDSAGHGESRREPISFVSIIGDFVALLDHLGEAAAAWIGHSAGGQGMMAARARHGVGATSRYVCLATPIAPYVPIDALRRETGASDGEIARAKAEFGAHFGQSWEAMERGALYAPDPGRALLMVQDRADPLVRHEDSDRIAAAWPGAVVFKTNGLGHNRVLHDAGVIRRIVDFVAGADAGAG